MLAGTPGAKLFVQFFEVIGEPHLHDNGTPPGTEAKHGFSRNHRCDDYLTGVEYRPRYLVNGGIFPAVPPTRTLDGRPSDDDSGQLVYLRWRFTGTTRPGFAAGRRYAFMLGIEEPGAARGFTLANANAAGVNAPPSLTDESLGLETEPARRLAQAFRDYGAYVVDDTAWDVYALVTEWGPAGRVTDEFKRGWGFEINPRSRDNPWSRDMDRIFTNLHVVDNNGSDRIGGGGQPRVLLAEPLSSPACPTATERRVPPQCLNPTLIQTSKRNPWSAGAGPRFDDRAAKMYQLPVKTTIDLPNEPPHRAWGQPSNPRPGP